MENYFNFIETQINEEMNLENEKKNLKSKINILFIQNLRSRK